MLHSECSAGFLASLTTNAEAATYRIAEADAPRPELIHRAAVDFETPHTRAASRTEPPGTFAVTTARLPEYRFQSSAFRSGRSNPGEETSSM